MSKATVPATCKLCGQPFYLGVQHICPAAAPAPAPATNGDSGIRKLIFTMIGPLLLLAIVQIGGGIWWASSMQARIGSLQEQLTEQKAYFQEQLKNQKDIIDRIDGYFRRPPPQ